MCFGFRASVLSLSFNNMLFHGLSTFRRRQRMLAVCRNKDSRELCNAQAQPPFLLTESCVNDRPYAEAADA